RTAGFAAAIATNWPAAAHCQRPGSRRLAPASSLPLPSTSHPRLTSHHVSHLDRAPASLSPFSVPLPGIRCQSSAGQRPPQSDIHNSHPPTIASLPPPPPPIHGPRLSSPTPAVTGSL